MKRIFGITLAIVVTALLFAGCATPPENEPVTSAKNEASDNPAETATAGNEDDKLVIGVTLLFRTDDWSVDIERSMKKVGDELGIELMFADPEGDSAKMIQYVEDYISMGVDAIASLVPDQATSDAILDACNTAGIPLFLFDSSLEDYSGVTAYTTCDAYQDGVNIANWIKDYADKNLADKETINVAAIDFFPSEICKIRTDGCLDTLGQILPNYKLVSRQDGKAARAESMSVMENILTGANDDVDIAVSIAGWDATAGVRAAIEAKGTSTIVIGVAWGEECCMALENKDSIVQAILLGLPSDMAKIIHAANDYFNGELKSPKVEYSYVMADHETIFDIDWRAIKGIE